jgi:hypothetical protein
MINDRKAAEFEPTAFWFKGCCVHHCTIPTGFYLYPIKKVITGQVSSVITYLHYFVQARSG